MFYSFAAIDYVDFEQFSFLIIGDKYANVSLFCKFQRIFDQINQYLFEPYIVTN